MCYDTPALIRQFGHAHAVLLDEAAAGVAESSRVETAAVPAPDWFSRAVRSRQRGYVAGRHCASTSLASAGARDAHGAMHTGAFGAPQWPAGFTGSITHSAHIAAALVAPLSQWRSVGIDCEPVIDPSTAAYVAERIVPEQRDVAWTGPVHRPLSFEETLTIGFAAKESIYKCLNPLVHEFFGFDSVRLESIDLEHGLARFILLRALGEEFMVDTPLAVRFSLEHGHVFAASALAVM